MIINHNIPSLVTNNALQKSNISTDKSSKRLSTGKRLNSASDDAAGMAIANKMKTQVRGIQMADRNCNDAISLIQTAEGGLSEIQNMLQRMRELAIQAANGTLVTSDRGKIQDEVDQLISEIGDTSKKVQFNTLGLFDTDKTFKFQVGQNEGLTLSVSIDAMTPAKLCKDPKTPGSSPNIAELASTGGKYVFGTEKGAYVDQTTAGTDAIETCDGAIDMISSTRSSLGAVQNRLEYTISSLGTSAENAQTALSRIEDTDMASEMTEYTKNNVIVQAGLSMLGQANNRPNQLLNLLQ